MAVAKRCSGGLILGFSQFETSSGHWKKGTKEEKLNKHRVTFPTPWNQLEAGILFSLNLPILVFREPSISGGIFDLGVTDVFIHRIPDTNLKSQQKKDLRSVILKWQADLRSHYYEERSPIG